MYVCTDHCEDDGVTSQKSLSSFPVNNCFNLIEAILISFTLAQGQRLL